MGKQTTTPTKEQVKAFQGAFEYFNAKLFDDKLPDCFLNFSRSNKRTMGFFIPETWEENEVEGTTQPIHEISLCPVYLNRDLIEVMSTLVHEMVHLWQEEFGKPSRRGYHNKEWAQKMVSLGLFPSNTGKKGGKMTGQRMSHYILPGKPFDLAFQQMPKEFQLPFVFAEGHIPPPPTGVDGKDALAIALATRRKVKYTCPNCGINIWGKPELFVCCGDCETRLGMTF